MPSHHVTFMQMYYSQLKGAVILDAGVRQEDEGAWPFLKVKTADGEERLLEVSQDEEGNGPGFLFGLPVPTQEEVKAAMAATPAKKAAKTPKKK